MSIRSVAVRLQGVKERKTRVTKSETYHENTSAAPSQSTALDIWTDAAVGAQTA